MSAGQTWFNVLAAGKCVYHFKKDWSWWRHQMETFSASLAIRAGNSPVPGEFPAQRPVTRSFGAFFDLRLNKRLSEQAWGWWFETLPRPLWRHSNVSGTFLFSVSSISIYSVWPNDDIWRRRSASILAQIMVCWITASIDYLKRCWLISNEVQWRSPRGQFHKKSLSHQLLKSYWKSFILNLIQISQGSMN